MSTTRGGVCAVITEETTEGARIAMKRAASQADLIELRLDYLRDFDFNNIEGLESLLADKTLPLIITCRASSEGGQQHIEHDVRLRLLVEGVRRGADYCDIEAAHYEQAAQLSPDLSRLIVSYHDFHETPSNLDDIYDRVCALQAAVHKIVTQANSITDTLAIFRLLDRARTEGRQLIALAMGKPGLITRVLGPSRGAFLTYGSLGIGCESAPGQITCRELRHLYRTHELTGETMIAGIIGRPVSHSASPAMHNAAFRALGLDFVYLPLEVDDVAEFFRRFVAPASHDLAWNLRGLSVTIPHKTAVMPYLDRIDETAARIGAVNTVVIDDQQLIGYNSDAAGAIRPLEEMGEVRGRHCGVIGAGGAARAVAYGLLERGARVTVFARNLEKAASLARSFAVSIEPIDGLISSDVEIVINATPVGMAGHDERSSPVPRVALRGRDIAYDLVYNPPETRFLEFARLEGSCTVGGIEMLVGQAAVQFELWTGARAPISVMKEAAIARVQKGA
jgi:3-dehydroquinate dehydratase/shikimate dehydrogenase